MRSNKLRLLLCTLVAFFFTCCKEDNTNVFLQQMEQIKQEGDSTPQKALTKLLLMEPKIKLCKSDYTCNKYTLLKTRLQDKCDIIPTSSDTIESVVRYFINNGSIEEQMEAYYYEASVYRDLKDYPRAVTAFCKVLELAEVSNVGDCRLLQNTYSQLSGLYIYQQLYDKALYEAMAGCGMAERTNTVDPIYLMDVASAAWYAQDSATHIEYCLKTLDCLKKYTIDIYPSVACELLIRFSDLRKNSEAKECYTILHSSELYKIAHNYLSAIAIYHDLQGNVDSAMIYYKRIMEVSTLNGQRKDAAHRLMNYYIDKKDYGIAVKYVEQYAKYVDTVFKEYQYESTSRASGEHLYAISLKKELQAREDADRYKNGIYGITVFSLIIALMGGFFYHKKREHYLKELLRKDEALGTAREVIVQKEDDLHAKEMQIRDIVRISLMEKASIDAADILQHFKDASEGKCEISVADWQNLYTAVEDMYPGFRETVMSMPRCTESYKNTAYLLKIGFNNAQIATLTGGARTTVWERVKRVKENLNSLLDS